MARRPRCFHEPNSRRGKKRLTRLGYFSQKTMFDVEQKCSASTLPPRRGIFRGCWARAVSDHVAAAPPTCDKLAPPHVPVMAKHTTWKAARPDREVSRLSR